MTATTTTTIPLPKLFDAAIDAATAALNQAVSRHRPGSPHIIGNRASPIAALRLFDLARNGENVSLQSYIDCGKQDEFWAAIATLSSSSKRRFPWAGFADDSVNGNGVQVWFDQFLRALERFYWYTGSDYYESDNVENTETKNAFWRALELVRDEPYSMGNHDHRPLETAVIAFISSKNLNDEYTHEGPDEL